MLEGLRLLNLWACTVCFGDPDSPLSAGLNMGILTLLVFLVIVLVPLALFFLNVRKRIMHKG